MSFLRTSCDKSIIPLSLIPLSTTLANSITAGPGGPVSISGCASGRISAVQMKIPLSPISGKGLSGCTLIPVTTSVFPRKTLAEPLAFGITPVSIFSGRGSSNALPSTLFPCSKKSKILFFFNPSTKVPCPINHYRHYQKICQLMLFSEFHKPICIHR